MGLPNHRSLTGLPNGGTPISETRQTICQQSGWVLVQLAFSCSFSLDFALLFFTPVRVATLIHLDHRKAPSKTASFFQEIEHLPRNFSCFNVYIRL
jgi:hypothetical protein